MLICIQVSLVPPLSALTKQIIFLEQSGNLIFKSTRLPEDSKGWSFRRKGKKEERIRKSHSAKRNFSWTTSDNSASTLRLLLAIPRSRSVYP